MFFLGGGWGRAGHHLVDKIIGHFKPELWKFEV
jgi:hypothetical protein